MHRTTGSLALVGLLVLAACSPRGGGPLGASGSAPPTVAPAPSTTTAPTATSTTTTATTMTTAAPATDPAAPSRTVTDTGYGPFATTGGITLYHPGRYVEHVGFHQANNDGAQQLDPLPSAARPFVEATRDRGTGDRTAADVVMAPDTEVRAPVSGTVTYAVSYTLYCKYTDDIVIIDPDDRPGWQVKVLHILGLRVAEGDRVVAGETVIADKAHQLPFPSQVDDSRTADPAWPHAHIEVVDPSIPDIPNPGTDGC